MLEVRNITKIYNQGTVTEHTLFKDFSLTVEEGQFCRVHAPASSSCITRL